MNFSARWLRVVTLVLLSLALLPLRPAPVLAQAAARAERQPVQALVDQLVTEAMEKEHLPGVAFVLVREGRVEYARGYGFANLEKQTPVTPDKTIFRIGSITKLLTAHAIVQLADLNKISLNDDVNKYLTQPKVDSRYAEPVRFWHLLTHTAGFDQVGDRGREFTRAEDRKASLGEYLADTLVRIRPPGQVSCYDTWGMTLAGYLLERISGLSYTEYMRRNVFRPLGMTRASVETPEALKADLAVGYRYQNGKYIAQGYEYYATLPASSIDATALDMARYLIAVLGDGSTDGHTAFLSLRATHQIRQPQFANSPGIPAFAYGFYEDQVNGQRVIHHGGNMQGFATELYLVPEQKLGFFVAYNADREIGGPAARLRETLARRLMDTWFPASRDAQTTPAPLPIKTERFAGNYANNMYCHTCYEGEAGTWQMFYTPVKAVSEGVLEIDGVRLVAVEPLVFLSPRGQRVAFRADQAGRITHMLLYKNQVHEKMDERLLDEVLGAGWRQRPAAPLTALVYSINGEYAKAAAAYDNIAVRRPRDGRAQFNAGMTWVRVQKPEQALPLLQRAWELQERPPRTAYGLGAAYALKGDQERALEWLQRAVAAGFNDQNRLNTDPNLESLRADPRFKALLNR